LRTDDEPVRAQSVILNETKPKPLLLLFITLFSIRMRFLSVWKTGLARGARNGRSGHAAVFMTPRMDRQRVRPVAAATAA
jgi:hypothetical protein